MEKILAQNLNITNQTGTMTSIEGPLKNINSINDVINVLTSFLYPFAAVILLVVLIWGGYDLIMSAGEAEKITAGKAKITAGIVGFVLLILSFLIVKLFGFIFGLGDGIL